MRPRGGRYQPQALNWRAPSSSGIGNKPGRQRTSATDLMGSQCPSRSWDCLLIFAGISFSST